MTVRPNIGLTLDWQESGSFSKLPHYALREHYFAAIYAAGGLPIAIPHYPEAMADYLDHIDGLIVPGGDFGLLNDWYIDPDAPKPYAPSPRLAFDMAIIKEALTRKLPLLTICAGMQIMGGMFGCKMTPNIQSYAHTAIEHHQESRRAEYVHPVKVQPNTLLSRITQSGSFEVNTAHREAIISLPEDGSVIVNALAPDDVIEGIELTAYDFALGVQWHPEFFYDHNNPHKQIIAALVEKSTKPS